MWHIILFPIRLVLEPLVPVVCYPMWSLTYSTTTHTASSIGYWQFVGIISKWWLNWHVV